MTKNRNNVGYVNTSDSNTVVEIIEGNRGYAANPDIGVLTFNIQGLADRDEILFSESKSTYRNYISDRGSLDIGGLRVPLWGEGNNLYPQEVYQSVSENKLLPEVIEKQVKFLFGKGPRLYKEIIKGEDENQKRVRIPIYDKEIETWLNSWEEKGFAPLWEYLKNIITDFYYVKTCISKYHFNRSRRIGGSLPVAGLSYVGSDEARLAAKSIGPNKRIKNEDCKYVVVGDWLNISASDYEIYPRFSPSDPFKYGTAIAFNSDKTFTKWSYAFNGWFKGLNEYLKASRLTPKYLNSYLKNALNAHIHVSIPGTWYEHQKEILQNICSSNLMGDSNTPLQTEYRGVKLIDQNGKALGFYDSMVDQLITCELRRITQMMSGEGKNQGKLYATTKWGDEGWVFEDFPGKFKEFFDTMLKYDERADKVILANKGISSSITNVDSTGLISKSGNEAWYNYLLYVTTLTLDEYFILKTLNDAIALNFPRVKDEGIKIGFWIDIPSKLQDTTASERPAAVASPDA